MTELDWVAVLRLCTYEVTSECRYYTIESYYPILNSKLFKVRLFIIQLSREHYAFIFKSSEVGTARKSLQVTRCVTHTVKESRDLSIP